MPRPVRYPGNNNPRQNNGNPTRNKRKTGVSKAAAALEEPLCKDSKSKASRARGTEAIFRYTREELLEIKKVALKEGWEVKGLPVDVKAQGMEKPRLCWKPIEGKARGVGQPALVGPVGSGTTASKGDFILGGPVTPTFETGEVFEELITMLDKKDEEEKKTPSKAAKPPPPLEPLEDEEPTPVPPQLLPSVPPGLRTPAKVVDHQQTTSASPSPSPAGKPSPASSLGYNTASMTPPPSGSPMASQLLQTALQSPYQMPTDRQAAILQLQQLKVQQQQLLAAQADLRRQMYIAQSAQTMTMNLPHSPAHLNMMQQARAMGLY